MLYDPNGNLIRKGDTAFTWDARNRLVAITGPGYNASFKYDALGRRTEKTIDGKTTNYLYDGWDIVQEIENGVVTTNYLRGLNMDETLGISRSEGTYYYLTDALGSTIALTDTNGSISAEYYYDPFGETETSNSVVYNPFQYTGRENDGNDIYHYRMRYKIGERFISEDTIGLSGGDVNFYSYVGNNPVNYIDPWGLIRYNRKPPYTVPVTGPTLENLQCVERCLSKKTNTNLDLLITGGAEKSGHSKNSHHYRGEACDIAGPKFNPVKDSDVKSCASECGFGAGHYEDYPGDRKDHWHLQRTPGNGVPPLPRPK